MKLKENVKKVSQLVKQNWQNGPIVKTFAKLHSLANHEKDSSPPTPTRTKQFEPLPFNFKQPEQKEPKPKPEPRILGTDEGKEGWSKRRSKNDAPDQYEEVPQETRDRLAFYEWREMMDKRKAAARKHGPKEFWSWLRTREGSKAGMKNFQPHSGPNQPGYLEELPSGTGPEQPGPRRSSRGHIGPNKWVPLLDIRQYQAYEDDEKEKPTLIPHMVYPKSARRQVPEAEIAVVSSISPERLVRKASDLVSGTQSPVIAEPWTTERYSGPASESQGLLNTPPLAGLGSRPGPSSDLSLEQGTPSPKGGSSILSPDSKNKSHNSPIPTSSSPSRAASRRGDHPGGPQDENPSARRVLEHKEPMHAHFAEPLVEHEDAATPADKPYNMEIHPPKKASNRSKTVRGDSAKREAKHLSSVKDKIASIRRSKGEDSFGGSRESASGLGLPEDGKEGSSRRQSSPRNQGSSRDESSWRKKRLSADNDRDGEHTKGGERLGDLPTLFPGVISHRGDPNRALKDTPRAYLTTSPKAAGVTVSIRLSNDGVPIVFEESTLQKYGVDVYPEGQTWSELKQISNKPGQGPQGGILRFSSFLKVPSNFGKRPRLAYLDIKETLDDPSRVSNVLKQVLQSTPYTKSWQARLVICVPTERYISAFQQALGDHKLVLNCSDLTTAMIALNNIPFPLHFKFTQSRFIDRNGFIGKDGLEFIQQAKDNNRDVYVETGEAQGEELKWCILAGVAGIITDHPETLDALYWDYHHGTPIWKALEPNTLARHIREANADLQRMNGRRPSPTRRPSLNRRPSQTFHRRSPINRSTSFNGVNPGLNRSAQYEVQRGRSLVDRKRGLEMAPRLPPLDLDHGSGS